MDPWEVQRRRRARRGRKGCISSRVLVVAARERGQGGGQRPRLADGDHGHPSASPCHEEESRKQRRKESCTRSSTSGGASLNPSSVISES
jgi:hypothetical protein